MTPTDNLFASAAGRRQMKAARRSVLVQCDRCSAKGSGLLNARKHLAQVNLAASNKGPGRWQHTDCGGRFVAYDIEVGE